MTFNNIMALEHMQIYFDTLYSSLIQAMRSSIFGTENEIYGEMYFYSIVKLIKYLDLTEADHFVDIGSGFGKVAMQIALTAATRQVTGIEINTQRHNIAQQALSALAVQYQAKATKLNFVNANFLTLDLAMSPLNSITIAYVCATVFSFPLLIAIGERLNTMTHLRQIVALRKIPGLSNFSISKRIFLHGSWDRTPCYIYTKGSL